MLFLQPILYLGKCAYMENKPRFTFQNRNRLNKGPVNPQDSNPEESVVKTEKEIKESSPPPKPTPPARNRTESAPSTGKIALEGNLIEKHRELQRERDRLDFVRKNNSTELESCIKQAESLGIGSLTQLREIIAETEERDRQAIASFEEGLLEEEKMQSFIKEQLKQIDNE